MCELVEEVVREFSLLPRTLSPAVSWTPFLSIVIQAISYRALHTEPTGLAVELLGWLDLQLDDAPALILTGLNEGSVPTSVNADPFLPNSLRRHLGILDNERRYARDAYALTSIINSREEIRFVAGRTSARRDPLLLSRLLFACDAETEIGRASCRERVYVLV